MKLKLFTDFPPLWLRVLIPNFHCVGFCDSNFNTENIYNCWSSCVPKKDLIKKQLLLKE